MAKPGSWGPVRSGLYDVTHNANQVDEQPVPVKLTGDPLAPVVFNEGGFAIIVAGKAEPVGASAPAQCYPV